MSVMTSAVLESRAESVLVMPEGTVDLSGSAEAVSLVDFPDGLIVYSDGRTENVEIPSCLS